MTQTNKIDYSEARERFFRLVNDRPQDYDLIAHNAAAVMLNGVEWPAEFDTRQIGIAVQSFFLELQRRWEWALSLSNK